MKTLKLTLAILVITAAGAFAEAGGNPQNLVRVLSVKRDIFYFKVCQSFIGGTLEVYKENGELLFSDKIHNHKAILDFYFQEPGLYEIKIKKGEREVSFGYNKETPKPEVAASAEEIAQLSMLQPG